jgi:4-hydroxy-tetrahydrodipicolinate reductase
MKRAPVAIFGSKGRMGEALVRLAKEDPALELVATFDQGDSLASLAGHPGTVVIDFSSPAGTLALARAAVPARVGIVCGTTGLDEEAARALEDATLAVPVFIASNMSIGVHVLGELVSRAIRALGPGFDIEITEAHHRRKVDAPSGTALTLAAIAQAAKDGAPLVHGRQGRPGARPSNEIGMHALRGGDVIGDHTVYLYGEGERLELTHRASNRDLFARGALRAAAWLSGKAPGRYGMSDMVRF